MALTASEYVQLTSAVLVALTVAGFHLAHFRKQYTEAIEEGTRNIGPPWTTVVIAVNLIIARTILNLRSNPKDWPADLEMVQDQVAKHIDHRTIEHLQDAYRLEETLRTLRRWRRAGRRYSNIAAVITLLGLFPFFLLGMKSILMLWLPVLGAVIITILLHCIFMDVVDRRVGEAEAIHETLRGAFE